MLRLQRLSIPFPENQDRLVDDKEVCLVSARAEQTVRATRTRRMEFSPRTPHAMLPLQDEIISRAM
jgi:hypothetical protein